MSGVSSVRRLRVLPSHRRGEFAGFAIPGVPFGCTYALFAVGLVLTYQATGVFNFAFGAQAYAAAFVYTWATQVHHFPTWSAFVLTVLVMSPLLGLLFDRVLFSRIPATHNLAKIVTGLSLFVGIPALLQVIFGNQNLLNSPGVFWNIDRVYLRPSARRSTGPAHGGGGDRRRPRRCGCPAALHQSGPGDARGHGEPPTGAAGRGQRRVGSGGRLDGLERPGRSGRGAAGTAVRPGSGSGLHHPHGRGDRRRRLGRSAVPSCSRPGWRCWSGWPKPSSRVTSPRRPGCIQRFCRRSRSSC